MKINKVKMSFRIALMQLRKELFSQKAGMVMLLLGLYLYIMMQPVKEFAADVGYNITPVVLVFLSCDSFVQMIMVAGAVVLFSNAPFKDEAYPYLIVRSGRTAWVLGNCLYVVLTGGIYVLFLWSVTVLTTLPHIDFSMTWGKIWGTLAMTDAGNQYGVMFKVANGVRTYFGAGQALGLTLLLEWGCMCFIGICVYLWNRVANKPVGTWIGAGLALFDITVYNLLSGNFMAYSPASLAMLTNLIQSRWGLTLQYAGMFYGIGFCVMAAAILGVEKLRVNS